MVVLNRAVIYEHDNNFFIGDKLPQKKMARTIYMCVHNSDQGLGHGAGNCSTECPASQTHGRFFYGDHSQQVL